MSSVNSNKLKSDKRKRLTQACNSCHQKKTRCDGQKPVCGTCTRGGVTCMYPSRALKRGPRQGFTERLELRLDSLERKMEALIELVGNKNNSLPEDPPSSQRNNSSPNATICSPNIFSESTSKPSVSLESFQFLTPELSLKLLKLYFEIVHPILPILHPSTFFQRYKKNEIPNHLLYSMFSVVSKFSDCPELQMTPRWRQGEKFEAFAISQIVGVSDFSLDYLASLLLLGKSLYQRGQAARGWLFGGMAVRVAHFLDIHKIDQESLSGKSPTPESWLLAEKQRRTWWGCYTIDCYASAATGRPPAIQEHPTLVSLPKVTDGWEDDPSQNIPSGIIPSRGQPWFTHYIKLVTILRKVGSFVSLPLAHQPAPSLLNQKITSYFNELGIWLLQLPDELQMEKVPLNSPPSAKISQQHVWCLHALYNAIIIILYSSKAAEKNCPNQASQFCLASADAITTILSECFKVFSLVFSPFYLNYCAFLASTVYLDSLLHLTWNDLIGGVNKFAINYKLIQDNLVNWSMSEHYCRILKDIYYAKSKGPLSQAPAEIVSSLVSAGGSALPSHFFKFDENFMVPMAKNIPPLTESTLNFQEQLYNSMQIPRPVFNSTYYNWSSQAPYSMIDSLNALAPNMNISDFSRAGNFLSGDQISFDLMSQNLNLQ